jgi:hypothetical protein
MSAETIELVIRPGPRSRRTKSREGRYSAVWGERVVVTAKEPYFATARILISEGVDPNTVLTMRHEGSQTRSLTMPLGKAAGLMVVTDKRGMPYIVPWRGGFRPKVWRPASQNDEALARQPSENNLPATAK